MGLLDIFKDGGGSDGDGDEAVMDGGDALFDDSGSDDLDDLGGFDDFDDDGMGFGEVDDDGTDTDELSHRLEELENEVGSLSSTVNTVRSENEEISGTVHEVEENVRKLLDIYEMVTRGVNPFVDDVSPGGQLDGEFGLFSDDDTTESEDDIDDDIAVADAETFFDEPLLDDEADDDFGDFDADDEPDTLASDDEDGDGGKSFAELKAEYDAGDAEWADGEGDGEWTGDDEADTDCFEDDSIELDDPFEDPGSIEDETFTDEDDLDNETFTDEGPHVDADSVDDAPNVTFEETDDTDGDDTYEELIQNAIDDGSFTDGDIQFAINTLSTERTDDTGKPYLRSLDAGYVDDLVVLEWLEFLVDRSSIVGAARAIEFYETVDWIDPLMGETLRDYLIVFGGTAEHDDAGGDLGLEQHVQSLRYIHQLANGNADSVVLTNWLYSRRDDRGL